MAKKREADYNEDNKMVVSNKYVRAIHPKGMGINAMKLFRIVITQCRMKDDQFYCYEFKIADLAEMIGIYRSNIYREAENMCRNMMQMLLKFGGEGGEKSWKFRHIFEKCDYDAESGTITIELHKDMTDLFLRLRRDFTQIPIETVLSLKSRYAIRLYELICEKMMGHFPYTDVATEIQITLEEARKVTGTDKVKTYDKISNFRNKVLMPAIREIEEQARWKIVIVDIKKGRTITGFSLQVWDGYGYEVVQRRIKESRIKQDVWSV